jgi:hypothetical protein
MSNFKYLTLRYLGADKYVIRHFNYSAHKVPVRSDNFGALVFYDGNGMGRQKWEQFFEDWDIIDRRVLIEKKGFYI